ncbi:MFS transporter [Candidatus Woesearchaeota archaeon]|nr:MFS transporter [Candidatus Woesearchaeota archaeon]
MKLNQKTTLYAILAITLVLLLLPVILRASSTSTYFGTSAYYELRIANLDWRADANNYFLELRHNPFNLLLKGLLIVFNEQILMLALPLILGLLTQTTLFYLLKNFFKNDYKKQLITQSLIATAPPFLYTFSTINPYSLILLLTTYLLMPIQNKKIDWVKILITSFILGLFNWHTTILVSGTILVYALATNKKKFFVSPPLILLTTTIFRANQPTIQTKSTALLQLLKNTIFDLGGISGLAIFFIILAAIGFFISWDQKRKYYPIYFAIITLSILSIYNTWLLAPLTILLAILAANAFYKLSIMKWTLEMVKYLTLLSIAYGLLFSAISYASINSQSPPTIEQVNAAAHLKNVSVDMVLAHPDNAFLIQYFGDKKTMITPFTKDKKMIDDYRSLLRSENLENTKKLLQEHSIGYIYIDQKITNIVKEKQGLRFLLRNNQTFKQIYENEKVSIWRVKL